MNEKQIKQFQQLQKVFNTDKVVTIEDITAVLKGITSILNDYKKSTKELNADTLSTVKSFLLEVEKRHNELLQKVKEKTDTVDNTEKEIKSELKKNQSEIEKKIKEAIDEVKSYQAIDGKDADEDKIVDSVLTKIKLPEQKEIILDDGKEIVAKINSLDVSEDNQIDASHIKNLPKSGNISSPRLLKRLSDVAIDGVTNGQVLTYNSTTEKWENGTGGGGSGTVTSVSVVTANGISGTVATATTTPAITLDISALDATKIADGTVTSAEFQYLGGVTSDIQTQLNAKQASDAGLTDIAGLAVTDGNIIVGNGTNWVAESGATARTSLGLTIGTDVQAYSSVLANTTASFTTADETKLDFITVTQAVNLDTMESDIAALANGMVYKGNWDASVGTFPGAGLAEIGWFYTVSVGGTVDSVVFNVDDRLIALADNASTTVYAANWTKLDATDAVTSVAGRTGNVVIVAGDLADFDTEVSNNTDVSANTSARHAALTVTDSAEIDFTLTGQDLTGSLIAGSIDETKLDASVNASLDLADSALQSLSGAVLTDQTVGQTIGATGARLTKLWATDITVTNAIAGSITGNAATVTTNANLTGEVTSTGNAAVVDKTAITGKSAVTAVGTDYILISDASDSGNLKKALVSDISGGGGNTYFNNEYIDQSGGTSDTYGVLAGAVNSSNALYTVSQSVYATGTLRVYLNGQIQTQGSSEDWVETTPASGTFTFATAPQTGDLITVIYQTATLSSDTVLLDTDIGVTVQAYTPFNGARVYKSSGQASVSTTLVAMTFDTESYDTNTYHDNTTNNSRLTVPATGYYRITGWVTTNANAASRAGIRLNGTTYLAQIAGANNAASTQNGSFIATDYYLTSGDYVELMGAFGTSQTTTSGIAGTVFSIQLIG